MDQLGGTVNDVLSEDSLMTAISTLMIMKVLEVFLSNSDRKDPPSVYGTDRYVFHHFTLTTLYSLFSIVSSSGFNRVPFSMKFSSTML